MPPQAKPIKEGGFIFTHIHEHLWKVSRRGKRLGFLNTYREAGGRYCFALDKDKVNPRTYRGRLNAAFALSQMNHLANRARLERWEPERIIAEAWKNLPSVSREQ